MRGDSRMATIELAVRKILNGPPKFDMLLGQYDYPRMVKFLCELNVHHHDGTVTVHQQWDEIQIFSATMQARDIWLIAGTVLVGTEGFGTEPMPVIATYSTKTRLGEATINYSGKGAAVIYIKYGHDGGMKIRWDLGKRKQAEVSVEA